MSSRFGRILSPIPLVLALVAAPAFADGIVVSVGTTGEGDAAVRIAYDRIWRQDSFLGSSELRWDVSYTNWQIESEDVVHTISASPYLRYDLGEKLYLDFGIGLAAFSDDTFVGKDLGSNVTFENRIGLGMRMGDRHELQLQARHYSNAHLAEPNDGIEFYSLGYRFNF